ncbi:CocE/NonD family hydrolase [Hoylesella oralis]|uniref:CocE/NonD family hydrolase n=1 Tax=Hoylesella oralis TaxID=28134 RepID=UPI0028ECAC27|nr:CocE/NonD family hydrolase [Hoylesella oralis]
MNYKQIVLYLFLSFSTFQGYSQPAEKQQIENEYAKREVMIPMRDGTKLYTAIYEPRTKQQRHPILMFRTPYGSGPYGKQFTGTLKGELRHYTAKNYIIVWQDVRGRYMSEGEYENMRPVVLARGEKTNDVTDAYDTADWLVKHTHNNGCIGVTGSSYLGYYALTAALCKHPSIKAVCPQAPIGDWFMGDDVHHNGALMLTDSFRFLWEFGRYRSNSSPVVPPSKPYYFTDEYSFFLRMGTISDLSKLQRDSLPFWKAMLEHPDYDKWWQLRNPLKQYEKIDIPVMVVGGLFDAEDAYGTWNSYKALARRRQAAPLYLLMGPWEHGGWLGGNGNRLGEISFGSEDLNDRFRTLQQRFFDYYLNHEGVMDLPPVTMFFTGENCWRTFAKLPAEKVEITPIYLHAKGVLGFDEPAETSSYTQYVSDPAHPVPYTNAIGRHRNASYMTEDQRFALRRNDVIAFVTQPLEHSLTLCGAVGVDLSTSISTTDADFVVKLIDVFPDDIDSKQAGYQMLVRGDIMRGRYRNSFSKPEAFIPNEIDRVAFPLADIAHTFLKGHRIMVHIQSSWFPLADRNPQQFINIYHCTKGDFVKSSVKIYHEGTHASKLMLPVLR